MNLRSVVPTASLCFSLLAAVLAGCSSSSSPSASSSSCTAGDIVACTCANGSSGTQLCGASTCECSSGGGENDASTPTGQDSSTAAPHQDASTPVADTGAPEGDGGHTKDGAPPSSLYGACAVQGGFGWPCTVAGGNDPTNCTDPEFPYCFSGGQGSWCTKSCASDPNACTTNVPDAGCAPTQCNARGYCK